MDVIGATLEGGLQVLREIGRGALARVYLASDGARVRALKLFPSGQEARVLHEFSIACDLEHPHLNRVDATVVVGGRPGVVMPLVPGRRLTSRGDDARAREAYLDAFEGLLGGLAYLHARGVVHRDVKPENVLIDRAGLVRIIDFDLAARLGSPEASGALVGTVAYLSPEQARGATSVPASDLYAAGVMLHAALTREVPFTGTVAEVVRAHRELSPPSPSSFDPELAFLDAYAARMLAKMPEERYPDGASALAALREIRGGRSVRRR
ncbi:MAG: serine/threonine protein kinase [Trueperaceae bacterium]|nr:serine/threonine protein kinase [Trueperaceae bacterium]